MTIIRPSCRADRELHVRAAGIDADLAQHRHRGVAHDLVFLVGQRLRRCDGNRVAGVHAHRVEVLDRADDDAVVLAVAHHLHLELFPADQRLLDQQLAGRAGFQAALADFDELFLVVGNAATRTAHGERRADDCRIADHRLHLQRFLHRVRHRRTSRAETDAGHRRLEFLAVLGLVDGFLGGADHLDAKAFENAVSGQIERTVQRRLPTHGRQQRVGPLLGDDLFDDFPGNRLDIGDVRHFRIGHDRRRIGVHQDHPVAFLAQRLAGLRTGVVELAGLSDDDRTGADDQNALDVSALGHVAPFRLASS
jgi:hypothetical protein